MRIAKSRLITQYMQRREVVEHPEDESFFQDPYGPNEFRR
jgi:hypothetical protein